MFKKQCKRCGENMSKKFDFCPHCGFAVKKQNDSEDYGMLGKNDEAEEEFNKIFPGMSGGMFNKMLSGAIKMLEKEMQKGFKNTKEEEPKMPKNNFQMYINGKKVNLEDMEQIPFLQGQNLPIKRIIKKPTNQQLPVPSEDIIKKATKLPRKEAEAELKRLANKIIYEIEAPGLKSMDRVLIRKLEQGVEVKIFAKDKVLYKNLAVKLPLIAYYLKQQKLFLEFQGK